MAQDKQGKSVGFGDWVTYTVESENFIAVLRIVKLSETPKGTTATGAFVDLVGNGRVAKVNVDVAKSTLVMRSDGTLP